MQGNADRLIIACLLMIISILLTCPMSYQFSAVSRPRRRTTYSTREPVSDPFRGSNRPSLHPTTINVLSDVLHKRSCKDPPFDETKAPLDLALGVGKLAVEAMTCRQKTSNKDGMEFSVNEQRTIAGRIVGVSMRLESLELDLEKACDGTDWIATYNDWDRFGVSPPSDSRIEDTEQRLASDALFRLCRAECLLALFMHNVEKPELEMAGETVPDKSAIDFIDEDRKEVLHIK